MFVDNDDTARACCLTDADAFGEDDVLIHPIPSWLWSAIRQLAAWALAPLEPAPSLPLRSMQTQQVQ